mmetsp:Transcript_2730/g.3969  ORF Transcript_2730/g.3969 Transcript_2730/m.3969 type:complete len:463 (+) Transcript_2730:139-1527(+)|eukprot:CAMPEP_0201552808 /NCGR_PEP_ID=MMETSP0173_2-20130828/18152_1 /ASSEMBLY_ACC=CAM_ASM_000268 /TAXON_ID=218659 /ORGANISM="Vexillifera sp., Strain DIVA3 564/2" /LENGTH=462 /DNA_ID=CAMNT_0047963361 /DNA_START=100 /DNA_END=1491 /DNA_ORIENTATION=+
MPKAPRRRRRKARHDPLEIQVLNETTVEHEHSRQRHKGERRSRRRLAHEKDNFVSDKLSAKILREASLQLVEAETDIDTPTASSSSSSSTTTSSTHSPSALTSLLDDSDLVMPKQNVIDRDGSFSSSSSDNDDNDEFTQIEEIELSASDAAALKFFMGGGAGRTRTLHDIILEKLREQENIDIATHANPDAIVEHYKKRLDPRVFQVYTGVGEMLRKYRGGRVPKAFKLMPHLDNWEELLWLTQPDNWSPAAMYYGTRIFASNLNARMAQRFFNLILLPRLREDFAEHKKLNYHHYQALKKTLYKPAAFFKGIVIPLCEDGDCTLREAVIFSSVLKKKTVPVLHSAATIMKLASLPWSGPTSIFLRTLINKKYSLPYPTIDALVKHFASAQRIHELPVLWHQCFLVFAQRYKTELTRAQKSALKPVLRMHVHSKITPLIRTELFTSLSRGEQLTNQPIPMSH